MSLKVFDLACEHGHVFEGWFGSAENYDKQLQQGLITCPVCSSSTITRKLSAPRLNVGKLRSPQQPSQSQEKRPAASTAVAAPSQAQLAQAQAAMFRHLREIVSNTENVGPRFAQEARSMHEGDMPPRAIRGTVTPTEHRELSDEGIAIMPIPEFLDDDRLQ